MRTTLLLDEVIYLILSAMTSHEGLGYNRAILFLIDESGTKLEGRMAIGPAHPEASPIVWKMIEESRITLEGLLDVYHKAGKNIDSELNEIIRRVKIPLTRNGGVLARAALNGLPVIVPAESAQSDLPADLLPLEIGQLAVIPIRGKEKVIGVLSVDNVATRKEIHDADVRRIMMLANHAGLALENAKSYGEAVVTAQQDSLTRLWNHGHFQRLLQEALHDADETNSRVSLVLFDVDDFKRYNDNFGHPAGDKALKEIARAARNVMRKSDHLARYGGEEFAAVLPGSSKEEAMRLAERLRAAIARETRITVSTGVATYPDDAEEKEKLIYCADGALYEAKRTGKNRVTGYRRPAA